MAEKENGRVGEKKKAWASLLLRGMCIHLAFRLVYDRSTGEERGGNFFGLGEKEDARCFYYGNCFDVAEAA